MVECGQCHTPLDEPSDLPNDQRTPCPNCKSLSRRMFKEINSSIEIYPQLGVKARRPGQKKPFIEMVQGHSFFRKTETWHWLSRVIDRANNWYVEHIIDPVTKRVIRHSEEKLTDHTGHGSARSKGKKKDRE